MGTAVKVVPSRPPFPLETEGSQRGGHFLFLRLQSGTPQSAVPGMEQRPPSFHAEQQAAYDAWERGESLFLWGPGGTGKTHLVRHIFHEWRRSRPGCLAVTALTGAAASLLGCGARTLHSWAGVGLGKDPVHRLVARIRRKPAVRMRWCATQALIVDEVSMMSWRLLETLDAIAKIVRHDPAPMGGLQVMFTGDFYQLPPIPDEEDNGAAPWLFRSPLWKCWTGRDGWLRTLPCSIMVRQRDPGFQRVLAKVRRGVCDADVKETLLRRQWHRGDAVSTRPRGEWGVLPTMLFSLNADVDAMNRKCLAQVIAAAADPATALFEHTVTTVVPEDASTLLSAAERAELEERLDRVYPYERTLQVAVGAQVMLVANLNVELGLVNGTRGVVTSIHRGTPSVTLRLVDDREVVVECHAFRHTVPAGPDGAEEKVVLARCQLPLRLAWATTIHKSQGASLDYVACDLGTTVFAPGQAYVALSRARTLQGLFLSAFTPRSIRADPEVLDYAARTLPVEKEA